MKIWIYQGGLQQGPYTFEELRALGIDPSTPVWYEGLPQWTPAGQAPATMPLFVYVEEYRPDGQTDEPADCDPTTRADDPQPWDQSQYGNQPRWQPAPQQWQEPAQQPAEAPRRPSSFFVWNILLTVLCCTPFSVIGIITGAVTNSRYNAGNYEGARKMSEVTEWMVMLAIVFAVIGLPLMLAIAL